MLSVLFALVASAPCLLAAPLENRAPSVAQIAGGGPPNSTAPPSISDSAVADFSAVNFLENLESDFFEQALKNITAWQKNDPKAYNYDYLKDVVTKIQAQEQIHVQTAETLLKHFNKPTFTPCKYLFPVNNPQEFIQLASVITTVGIGGVINIASGLAETDPTIVQGPASIVAMEARHDAFFRETGSNQKLVPNPAPFDTRLSAGFVLNLANPFIVPGSCAAQPPFTVIPGLSAVSDSNDAFPSFTKSEEADSAGPISFTFNPSQAKVDSSKPLYIGWVNQANAVNYQAAKLGSNGQVSSSIPSGFGGIAFAALTQQNGAADVNALTPLTIAGPAPVRVS